MITGTALRSRGFAGVRGTKSLQLAGRVADGTILAEPCPVTYLQRARTQIAAGARSASRTGLHPLVSYNLFGCDSDASLARQRLRQPLAGVLGPEVAAHLAGLPFAANLLAMIAGSDLSDVARTLQDDWIDELCITGTIDHCAGRIHALHEAGGDTVVLVPAKGQLPEAAIAVAGTVAALVRRGADGSLSPQKDETDQLPR